MVYLIAASLQVGEGLFVVDWEADAPSVLVGKTADQGQMVKEHAELAGQYQEEGVLRDNGKTVSQ